MDSSWGGAEAASTVELAAIWGWKWHSSPTSSGTILVTKVTLGTLCSLFHHKSIDLPISQLLSEPD